MYVPIISIIRTYIVYNVVNNILHKSIHSFNLFTNHKTTKLTFRIGKQIPYETFNFVTCGTCTHYAQCDFSIKSAFTNVYLSRRRVFGSSRDMARKRNSSEKADNRICSTDDQKHEGKLTNTQKYRPSW